MRRVVGGVLALIALASCEDNVTNVTLAVDSTAACRDTLVIIKRVPCVWRDHVGWLCLDAPLPEAPEDDEHEGSTS